jgi:hypothetical protein
MFFHEMPDKLQGVAQCLFIISIGIDADLHPYRVAVRYPVSALSVPTVPGSMAVFYQL